MQQLLTAVARLLRDESGVVPQGDALTQISGTVEVTFKDFSELARRRGWTVQFLAERFRGTIEEPTEFFTRVLTCRYQGEYRGDVVIPYRSVIDLYRTELTFRQQETGRERFCACGCGNRVWDRKKWATGACRKRAQRTGARTPKTAFVSS